MRCTFCKNKKEDVDVLIAGPEKDLFICDNCVRVCSNVLDSDEHITSPDQQDTDTTLTPEIINQQLDNFVVGQQVAKEILSVAIYNHHKRICNPVVDGTAIQKSNILFVGPSGTGKTLLASSIAHLLDVPFAIIDSTSITEAGYVGKDVESIFQRLIQSANGDIKKAQHGIVFIDEIDKKVSSGDGSKSSRDVSGEGVQQSLLRIVERDIVEVSVPGRKGGSVNFDTTNVLFIVGGAFVGLENIIKKRMQKGPTIGIGATVRDDKYDTNILSYVEPEDLHNFGLIREFVGRFPVIVPFENVNEEMLIKIMKEPKDCIVDQFKGLFKLDGVELEFDDQFIRTVAKQSIERKTGARGLRNMFEKYLNPIQYTLPTKSKEGVRKIRIDKVGNPLYTYRPGRRKKAK